MEARKQYYIDLNLIVYNFCKETGTSNKNRIAEKLNISVYYLKKWRRVYPLFKEAIKKGQKDFYNF